MAGKTGLNYAALIRYLKFLKTLRLVDFISASGSLISITNVGRSFRRLLAREDGPDDISEEVLDGLVSQSQSSKDASHEVNPSCLFCGKTITRRAITKEVDGNMYSFDKAKCATFFMKFRSAYGREFLE